MGNGDGSRTANKALGGQTPQTVVLSIKKDNIYISCCMIKGEKKFNIGGECGCIIKNMVMEILH